MKSLLTDTDPQVQDAVAVLTEWRRKQYIAALTKVAMDWQDHVKDWGKNADVGVIEVQAFLDSRVVHYPECWGPDHPHYNNPNYRT